MLQWFRARARSFAGAILVSLAGLGGLSPAHGGDCHDDDCGLVALRHDASSHAIGTALAGAEHALHCILCHWTRSTRPSTEAVHQPARPLVNKIRLHTEMAGVLSPVQAAQPPLRSPPTAAIPTA